MIEDKNNGGIHARDADTMRCCGIGKFLTAVVSVPTEILGNGIYGFSEAARLTGLNPARVRAWFHARKVRPGRGVVFDTDYPGEESISFLDLIEVLVAGKLREQGVSLISIRKVHQTLVSHFNTPHPFSRKELFTDGHVVFVNTAHEAGEDEMVEILKQQRVFPSILLPFLKRVDYDAVTRMAKEWKIAEGIVIDPSRRYGKPIVESCGIPTAILAAAYHANQENADRVAAWFGVTADDVAAAVGFESQYPGKAA